MVSYHASVKVIGKSGGRNSLNAAAYRSASRLTEYIMDEGTGITITKTWDYSRKKGVVFSKIFAPEHAPDWVYDRQKLWNKIEQIERKRDNGQLARDWDIALPKELTQEQNEALIADIVNECFIAHGMVADINIHYDNENNPHAHVMLTMRELIKFDDGKVDFGLKNRDWNKALYIQLTRKAIADHTNRHLRLNGFVNVEVSHLSHKARGIGLEPTTHMGPASKHMTYAERKAINDQVFEENKKRILSDPSLIIDKLSIDKAVFSREDIESEIYKTLTDDALKIHSKNYFEKDLELKAKIEQELLMMYSIVISSQKITLINACDLKGRLLFARTDRMELESRLESGIKELVASNSHRIAVNSDEVRPIKVGLARKELTLEQKEAVVQILKGTNISILEGYPGSGKSTVMKEVVRWYREKGYEVIGTAPTNKASKELEYKIGIKVVNTTKLRQDWQKLKGYEAGLNLRYDYYKEEQYRGLSPTLKNKTILIIDEASTVDSPSMDYLVREVNKAGGKIIALGDNNQNQAIGGKGGFAKAAAIAGKSLLTEINRHKNSDEEVRLKHIEATRHLGRYEVSQALSIYDELGMFKISSNETEKCRTLADDAVSRIIECTKKYGIREAASKVAIGAYTNEEVETLNLIVRRQLKQAGILQGKGKLFRSGRGMEERLVELCVGDQIIFKRNLSEFAGFGGVDNNEIGIVSRLEGVDSSGIGEFVVKIKDDTGGWRQVKIKTGDGKFSAIFRHGYALTNYALQGADVDYKLFSIDKYTGYEAFNVGATRHKNDCKFYAARDTLENEVCKTKGLDIERIREEFTAYAYKYEDKQKVDVPLWMVGLRLLASKRADLSFAGDYAYCKVGEIEVEKLREINILRQNIEERREQLVEKYKTLEEWQSIGKVNDGLVVNSSLSTEEVKLLDDLASEINKLETSIREQAKELAKAEGALTAKAAAAHKLLSGNLGVMRGYLELRQRCIALQQVISKLDQELSQAPVQRIIQREASLLIGRHVITPNIKVSVVEKRMRKFSGAHFNKYVDEVKQLKQINIEQNRMRLREIFNIGSVRETHIAGIVGKHATAEKAIESDDMMLIIGHIMATSKSPLLAGKYQELKHASNELTEAKEERTKYAQQLVRHYNSWVDQDQKQQNMGRLITQLGMTYETILKHAELNEVRHYFEPILKSNTIIDDPNFGGVIEVIKGVQEKSRINKKEIEKLKGLATELFKDIDATKEVLQEHEFDLRKKQEWLQEHKAGLEKVKRFEQEIFPHYLAGIYHEDTSAVLNKLDKLLATSVNKDDIVAEVSANPGLLGKVKNRGLLARLLQTDNSKAVAENIEKLGENIATYIEGQKMKEKEAYNLSGVTLVDEIKRLEQEIEKLKLKLPSKEENQLLDDIEKWQERVLGTTELKDKVINKNGLLKILTDDQARNVVFEYEAIKELALEAAKIKERAKEKTISEKQVDKKREKKKLLIQEIKESARGKIDYEAVKNSLNRGIIEHIFRQHANLINSDGKIVKKGNSIKCGSLDMNLRNGLWFRFSDKSKGDVFGLVREATGCSNKEAYEYVAKLVGIRAEHQITKNSKQEEANINNIKEELRARDEWIAYKIVPEKAPKFNPNKDLAYTLKTNRLEGVYEYSNEQSQLAGYTLRLVDKDSGSKQVLPVGYCYNEALKKNGWRLKGLTDEKGNKPIYGLHKLNNDNKTILIVEGEKTADRAQELLPEYSVMSWLGGSNAAGNVNWSKLKGREVVIWPDNDKSGFEASTVIADKLNDANLSLGRVTLVNTQELDLPEKWDLADELPAGKSLDDIRNAINLAKERYQTMEYIYQFENQIITKDYYSRQEQEIAAKGVWQNRSCGELIAEDTLKDKVKGEIYWKQRLGSEEAISFVKYAEAKGILESEHEFLKLGDTLYRDTLAAIACSRKMEPKAPIGEQISKLQQEYADRRKVASIALAGNSCYQEFAEKLKEKFSHQPEREELYKRLAADLILLHQEQLGKEAMPKVYTQAVCELVNKEVRFYNKPRSNKEVSNKLTDEDKVKIAEKLSNITTHKDWWQNLAERQIEHKSQITFERYKLSIDVVLEQIDGRIYNHNNKNFDRLRARTYEHAYERWLAVDGVMQPDRKEIQAMIGRSLYELTSYKRIKEELKSQWHDHNEKPMPLAMRIEQGQQIELLSRIRGHELEKVALAHPDEYLNLGKYEQQVKDKAGMALDERKAKVEEVLKINSWLVKVKGVEENRNIAKSMVDHELCYGRQLINTNKFKEFEQIAKAEAGLAKELSKVFKEKEFGHSIGAKEMEGVKSMATSLLHNSIVEQHIKNMTLKGKQGLSKNSNFESLYKNSELNNKIISHTVEQVRALEQEFKQEEKAYKLQKQNAMHKVL